MNKLTVISFKFYDDLVSNNIIVDTDSKEIYYLFFGHLKSINSDLNTFEAEDFSIITSAQALKTFKNMNTNRINGNKNEYFSERIFNISDYEKELIFNWIEDANNFKVIL